MFPTDDPEAPAPSDPPAPAPSAGRLLILNAIVPGLGHLVAGRRRTALVLALPVLALLVIGVLVAVGGSMTSIAARLFDPVVLAAILLLNLLLVLWRLGALVAVRRITPIRATASTIVAGVVAVAIVLVPHLYVAGLTVDARDAALAVYAPVDSGGAWVPTETAQRVPFLVADTIDISLGALTRNSERS